MKQSILVIGNGGRESAIAKSLRISGYASDVGIFPGNGNPDSLVNQPVPTSVTDYLDLINTFDAWLTIVGPEKPLVEGVTDLFESYGLTIVGPNMEAAQLEGSKIYAKRAMKRWNVPTASFQVFASAAAAIRYINTLSPASSLVVKADGLAGGKGVFVVKNRGEAIEAVNTIAAQHGERMVVEERLYGQECTFTVFVRKDGKTIVLPTSADHKRLLAGDEGPNTGGMGAYAPHPAVTNELEQVIIETIVEPTLAGLSREKIGYTGFLYFGLMLTELGPKVLEYNVRLGDPEAGVILPLVRDDFWELTRYKQPNDNPCGGYLYVGERFGAIYGSGVIGTANKVAVSVVLASEHYPSSKHAPVPVFGIDAAEQDGAVVLHAGTKTVDGQLVTNGGRVLNVVGIGSTYAEARTQAYKGVSRIYFKGMQYRTDIAKGL